MMDIKDFFPSICHKQLAKKLHHELNQNNPNQITLGECKQLVDMCSISSRGLPLGFVTSPILSNIYLKDFDGIFYGVLKSLGFENILYTRYADDLTVSFRWKDKTPPEGMRQIPEKASEILKRIGLRLNGKKTRYYNLNNSNHVRVTGMS